MTKWWITGKICAWHGAFKGEKCDKCEKQAEIPLRSSWY